MTTTHTGRDECHFRAVVEHSSDLVDALHSGLTGTLGAVAGSKTFGTQLQVLGYGRVVQGLRVGVAEHKRHVVDAFTVHVVHGVATATTDSDDLDDALLFVRLAEIENGRLGAFRECGGFLAFHIIVVIWHSGLSLK